LEKWNNIVYKVSRILQDKTPGYKVQNQKNTGHRKTGQWRNWKKAQINKSRGFAILYSAIHPFIQQKEI